MKSKAKAKRTTSKAKKKAPAKKPAPTVDDYVAALKKNIKFINALASVMKRLDAFVDALRPMLPEDATDEADALKAAIGELTRG